MQNMGGKQEDLTWFCKAPMCMHLQQVGFWHHWKADHVVPC